MATGALLAWLATACASDRQDSATTTEVPGPSTSNPAISTDSVPKTTITGSGDATAWIWDGSTWVATGPVPNCPQPLPLVLPVDITKVTAVLYPGQTRGGNYKAHGGFLFAPGTNDSITVTASLDGYLARGVRYLESGEVQYMFDVINSCGVMYRLDHLLTLSSRFQELVDTLPPPTASSGTTNFPPGIMVSAGEVIATAVGFHDSGNTTLDWGVYDLSERNAASADSAWLAAHPGEQPQHALCWLDLVPEAAQLRSLPGGDGTAGTTSDFCT